MKFCPSFNSDEYLEVTAGATSYGGFYNDFLNGDLPQDGLLVLDIQVVPPTPGEMARIYIPIADIDTIICVEGKERE